MRSLFFIMIGAVVVSAGAAVVTGLPHAQPWVLDSFERAGLSSAGYAAAPPLAPVAVAAQLPTQ
jgi:hypothetical protein